MFEQLFQNVGKPDSCKRTFVKMWCTGVEFFVASGRIDKVVKSLSSSILVMDDALTKQLNELYQEQMLAEAHREQVLQQTHAALAKAEKLLDPRRRFNNWARSQAGQAIGFLPKDLDEQIRVLEQEVAEAEAEREVVSQQTRKVLTKAQRVLQKSRGTKVV